MLRNEYELYKQSKQKQEKLGQSSSTKNTRRTINDLLIDQEEIEFRNHERMLKQQMLTYTRSMISIGNLTIQELHFLQQGVVFACIKIGYFGMDPEALSKKLFFMKQAKKDKKTTSRFQVRLGSCDSRNRLMDRLNNESGKY